MSEGPTTPSAAVGHMPGRDIRQARIIIADDELMMCRLLSALLRKHGFRNLLHVQSGSAVIEQLDRFQPDLLLLDMQMPDLSGLDVCKQVRARQEFVDMPVLIQTATVDRDDMGKLFAGGVSDFLTKPINPAELIARVLVHLERSVLLGEMRDYRERISRELDAARRLQCELMPSAEAVQDIAYKGGIRVSSYHRSSSEIGGDIWGLLSLDHRKFALFLADFTGHGVNAALNTFRLHALIHEHKQLHDDPGRLLTRLNEALTELLPVGQFATLFYVVVDCGADELRFASAGAPPAILKFGPNEPGHLISATGMPLGIAKGIAYDLHRAPFPPDATLIVFSDGLPEFADKRGVRITEAGLLEALNDHDPSASPGEIVSRLCDAAGITPGNPLQDDTTIVCLDRRAGSQADWSCDCPHRQSTGKCDRELEMTS